MPIYTENEQGVARCNPLFFVASSNCAYSLLRKILEAIKQKKKRMHLVTPSSSSLMRVNVDAKIPKLKNATRAPQEKHTINLSIL